jgi:hypothetical protein
MREVKKLQSRKMDICISRSHARMYLRTGEFFSLRNREKKKMVSSQMHEKGTDEISLRVLSFDTLDV